MMEEDRRAAVRAAADAVCFADRQGGDVWLAAAQLDSALLELRPALRRRRRFESRFELLRATTPSLSRPPLQLQVRARRPASAAAATTTTAAEVSVGVGVCVRVLLARVRGRRRPELMGFCVSELLRGWWSVRGCVCACLSTRALCRVPSLVSRFVWSFDLDLARAVEVNLVFSAVFGRGVTRKPAPLGVRCLLLVFVDVACFSSLN